MLRRSLAVALAAAAGAFACAGRRAPGTSALGMVSTVVVERAMLQWVDTASDLVLVVRDVDAPDRLIGDASISMGRPGVELRSSRARHFVTHADGTARLTPADSGDFSILVLRIGYERFQFSVRLREQCRQTLEIYIGRRIVTLNGRRNPSPTAGRAVLTTCSPAD